MLYSNRLNKRINYILKRAPRLTCTGNQFSYNELLENNDSVTLD